MKAVRAHASSEHIRVHAALNGLAMARAGFALTGMRRAVDRNRVRRRLLAALRPQLGELPGVDLVVTAGLGAATQPYAALRRDLARCVVEAVARVTRPRAAVAPSGQR